MPGTFVTVSQGLGVLGSDFFSWRWRQIWRYGKKFLGYRKNWACTRGQFGGQIITPQLGHGARPSPHIKTTIAAVSKKKKTKKNSTLTRVGGWGEGGML